MKCVLQRVRSASLQVDGVVRGACPALGLVVLVGIELHDADPDIRWMADKVPNLRIFQDEQGKMNRSVLDVGGSILLVPNFTLAGDASRGRRPSFDLAMHPDQSRPMFEALVQAVRGLCPNTTTGVFGAHMHLALINDGPVTILLDSRQRPE